MTVPTHARAQIRAAFMRALEGLPTLGIQLFPGRATDLQDVEMPGVVVTTAARNGELEDVAGDGGSIGEVVTLSRTLPISVIGFDAGDGIEDRLDALALAVEQAVEAAHDDQASALMQLIKDIKLVATQVILSAATAGQLGQIRLSYEVDYLTVRDHPEAAVQ